jgi:acetyl-CoA carboxylase carboxyl transferase subunit beta
VIEQTIRQTLPDGFQTAGFLLEHGMLDLVEPRENLRRTIRNLLELHERVEAVRGVSGEAAGERLPETEGQPPVTDPDALAHRDPWEVVQRARLIDRPRTLDYVGLVFDEFQELQGWAPRSAGSPTRSPSRSC